MEDGGAIFTFIEDGGAHSKISVTSICLGLLSLGVKFLFQLTGTLSQQEELAIMNLIGAINSIRDWRSLNGPYQIEEIAKWPLEASKSELVKTVLVHAVIARMILGYIYPLTYIANFYPILTLCRERLLVPWLTVSAVKNCIVEFIVCSVVGFLYLDGRLPLYLLCEFFIRKALTLAPAIYNWSTINSFYNELKRLNRRRTVKTKTSIFSPKSSRVYNYPNIIMGLPMQSFGRHMQVSSTDLSSFFRPKKASSLTNYHVSSAEFLGPNESRKSQSLALVNGKEPDIVTGNTESSAGNREVREAPGPSCTCPISGKKPEMSTEAEPADFPRMNFVQDWLSARTGFKVQNRLNFQDYTDLLTHYADTESSKWSSDDESMGAESRTTIVTNVRLSREPPNPPLKIDPSQWRRRLEIIGSSFESTLQSYNQSDFRYPKKSTALDLRRSWILDGMMITGTPAKKNLKNRQKIGSERSKALEIEALRAYNNKTLWDQKSLKNFDKIGKKSAKFKETGQNRKTPEVADFASSNHIMSLRAAIANLDWSLQPFARENSNFFEAKSLWNFESCSVVNPVPDNTRNTEELLVFAFGFRDERVAFSFSEEVRSDPEKKLNVFDEIILMGRMRALNRYCNCRSTADVDYGENYWCNVQSLAFL